MLKTLSAVVAGIFALALCGNIALTHCRAWINISDSLPYGIYQTTAQHDPYAKGDLVLSCVPELYAHFAFDRGYIASGKCSAKTAPVGKYIAAVPGDQVVINHEGVFVNGTLQVNSRPVLRDGAGQNLTVREMNAVLQPGEYILLNPKANSFDSRYFGIVREELLLSKLQALLTAAS